MKLLFVLLSSLLLCLGCKPKAEQQETTNPAPTVKKDLSPADIQIKLAVLAAPVEKRDSCTVYGYDANNELVLLRKGTNELICLADNPNQPNFSVACYCQDLEPFMQRGRELKKQGIKDQELFDEREKEVQAGTLKMPKGPSTLYVYTAKDTDVDTGTGEVKNGYLRYVIYIPYATAESTGLPLKPSEDGMPWIMNPGTYRAHIMINP
ncbi:MAG: hypothetical protein GC171_11615 [Terrimonas sp.]|nr:hypothetical protein [Terrimonas sp.]